MAGVVWPMSGAVAVAGALTETGAGEVPRPPALLLDPGTQSRRKLWGQLTHHGHGLTLALE